MRAQTAAATAVVQSNAYAVAGDPTRPQRPPEAQGAVPEIAFTPLDQAVARLKSSAERFQQAYAPAAVEGLTPERRGVLLADLQGLDQTLLSPDGLPGRKWYRNMVYAPGALTGYGVKTLPGVREAIEGRRWEEADRFAQVTAGVLNAYSDRLDAMSTILHAPL
jgi:N-acetylated-alpha-linked acidic dipeptidase